MHSAVCMTLCAWGCVHGAVCMALCAWRFVHGAVCMALCAWCCVHGAAGCWLIVDHCPSHPTAEGRHKDAAGTQSGTEDGCLARAAQQWKWCGSPDNGRVVAVYGPTGQLTCMQLQIGGRLSHTVGRNGAGHRTKSRRWLSMDPQVS